MIKIKVRAPDITRLSKLDVRFHTQLLAEVDKALKNAEYISKRDYLSGPNYRRAKNPTPGPEGVLGWKTGHLKGSVGALPVQDGQPIRGTLKAGPLPYATIHEFGGRAGRNRSARIPQRSYLQPALKRVIEQLKTSIFLMIKGLK